MTPAAAFIVAVALFAGIPLLLAAALGAFRRARRPTWRTVSLLGVALAASFVAYVPADEKPQPPPRPVWTPPFVRIVRLADGALALANVRARADRALRPYAERGLVLWLDGIWNAGRGTNNPSATVWSDLSGCGRDATLRRAADGWTGAALRTRKKTGGDAATLPAATFPAIPEASVRTVEVVCRIDNPQNSNGEVIALAAGASRTAVSLVGSATATSYRPIASTPQRRFQIFAGLEGNDPDLCALSAIHRYTFVFGAAESTNGWLVVHNGVPQPYIYVYDGNLSVQRNGTGSLFGRQSGTPNNADGEIYAVRVYDRALSLEEIQYNHETDRIRFDLWRHPQ